MGLVINRMVRTTSQNAQLLHKNCVNLLLGLAQSDREQECINYAVYKSSGISAKAAWSLYGFEDMNPHAAHLEEAIAELQQSHEMGDDIANMQDKAAIATFGITRCSNESSDDDCVPGFKCAIMNLCKQSLIENKYSWFCLMDMLEKQSQVDNFCSAAEFFPCTSEFMNQVGLIRQSKETFDASKIDGRPLKRVECVEGLTVTETESDDLQELHHPCRNLVGH